MTWLAVVVFDSREMRTLMHDAVHISIAGPYCLYLVGIADLMMQAAWLDFGFWIALVFMMAYTVGSIVYAAIFVPKVTNWIANNPIKVYPPPTAPPAEQLLARLEYAFDF